MPALRRPCRGLRRLPRSHRSRRRLLAKPAKVAPTAAPAPAETAPPVAAVEIPTPARNVRFLRWMIGIPAGAADRPPPDAIVEQMFVQLDQVIASELARAGLLPRAPHVVPQLMKTLRDEGYSSADVADRISKDVVLTAEVVRSATRILQREDDDGDIDLGRAVAVVGTQGLRRAIANVVPLLIPDARGDSLSARAATQIWKDADRKARLGAAIAGEAGLDPFDGDLGRPAAQLRAGPRHCARSTCTISASKRSTSPIPRSCRNSCAGATRCSARWSGRGPWRRDRGAGRRGRQRRPRRRRLAARHRAARRRPPGRAARAGRAGSAPRERRAGLGDGAESRARCFAGMRAA